MKEVIDKEIQKVSYEDFPADLRAVLDERISTLRSNLGICIAGRVTFSDAAPITGNKDVMVILHHGIDHHLRVYEGGWFIMRQPVQSNNVIPDKSLVLRAFGYDPVDASITILSGEVTYIGFEMEKTPPEKLACIKGTVTDEHGRPLEKTYLMLHFALKYSYEPPAVHSLTDSNGKYSFEGLSGTDYSTWVAKPAYASESEIVTVPQGKTIVKDVKLYWGHKITIDYVYQADGSRNFTSGELQRGTVNWDLNNFVDFSNGKVEKPRRDKDLELRQNKGVVQFEVSKLRDHKGLYDAGVVPFDSVAEAAEIGYATDPVPCNVGHVYVVRTSAEDNYAKFIVKSVTPY